MVSKAIILIIKFYQRFVSPFTPPSCRYYPSCSHYACESLQKHGAIKGLYLSVARVMRCHPWARGGYDPVPLPSSPRRITDS